MNWLKTLVVLGLCAAILLPGPALAQASQPPSLDFGYGARLNPHGDCVEDAIRAAGSLGLDWLAVDFDWSVDWPDPAQWDASAPFARAMRQAQALDLNVLLTIKNPPAWAMTPSGPSPELTAALVIDLTRMFDNIRAVEAYPEANTVSGWGRSPNPASYALLLAEIQTQLEASRPDILLLTGGLHSRIGNQQDMRDVDFLRGLYLAGWRAGITSVYLEHPNGTPLDDPSPGGLRHFEEIRAVMNEFGHSDGVLWVTSLRPPANLAPELQAAWLGQSYRLLRSHLYVGAVFYADINAGRSVEACPLITPAGRHLFWEVLGSLVQETGNPPVLLVKIKSLSKRSHCP
jgi:hypothetical protein